MEDPRVVPEETVEHSPQRHDAITPPPQDTTPDNGHGEEIAAITATEALQQSSLNPLEDARVIPEETVERSQQRHDAITPLPQDRTPDNGDGEEIAAATPSEPVPSSQIAVDTPNDGWVLNDAKYLARVAWFIKYGLLSCVSKAHVHSFLERLRKAELKRTKGDEHFWTTADPWIDAWMILTGRKREVFDITSFVKQHPNISSDLRSLRPAANLSSRCPVAKEMNRQKRESEGETSHAQETEEVPSQTYWTVVKRLMPW